MQCFKKVNGVIYKSDTGYKSLNGLISMLMNALSKTGGIETLKIGNTTVVVNAYVAEATSGEVHMELFRLLEKEKGNIPELAKK